MVSASDGFCPAPFIAPDKKNIGFPAKMQEIARVMNAIELPDTGDMPEEAWTKAAANNPVFDFLKDEAENLYAPNDGKPFHDRG